MNLRKKLILIMILFLIFLKAKSKEFEKEAFNITLAKVSNIILTSRHVVISSHLNNAMNEVSTDESLKTFDISSNKTLELAIETAIALDAASFQVAKVEPHEITELLLKIQKNLQKNVEWKTLDVTKEEFESHLERKLKVKKYLKFKLKSLVSIITDQDLRSYYDKNSSKLGDAEFESVKENIHSYLLTIKNEEQMRSWLEVIKKKYKVHLF